MFFSFLLFCSGFLEPFLLLLFFLLLNLPLSLFFGEPLLFFLFPLLLKQSLLLLLQFLLSELLFQFSNLSLFLRLLFLLNFSLPFKLGGYTFLFLVNLLFDFTNSLDV